jgi:hypothetical protein
MAHLELAADSAVIVFYSMTTVALVNPAPCEQGAGL